MKKRKSSTGTKKNRSKVQEPNVYSKNPAKKNEIRAEAKTDRKIESVGRVNVPSSVRVLLLRMMQRLANSMQNSGQYELRKV